MEPTEVGETRTVNTSTSRPSAFASDQTKEPPRLTEDQEEEMKSVLLEPVNITFSGAEERDRNDRRSTLVPSCFWRTSYETSITLSANTSKDTHAKHREKPELRIKAENSFQSVSPFQLLKDMNRERIQRHLVWNKKRDPSSYISAFNSLGAARRRAYFHYEKSERIGQRVFLAEISSIGLVAATVRAKCKTTVIIITKDKAHGDQREYTDFVFDVDIPVWIRDSRPLELRTDLNAQQFEELGPEIWISISELRRSNLANGPKSRVSSCRDYICAKGHDYEWLAAGNIPKSQVLNIVPFDGKLLHLDQSEKIIRSHASTEPWVWNWDKRMWVLDSALTQLAEWRDHGLHQAHEKKRRASGDQEDVAQADPKRPRLLELRIITPYFKPASTGETTIRGQITEEFDE